VKETGATVQDKDAAEASGRGPAELVRFVAVSVSGAVCLGLLVITATVIAVNGLRPRDSGTDLDAAFYLLVGGTLAGVLLAAYAAWRLLAPLQSTYRRGGLSIVSAFATILLMMICIPVDHQFGPAGLLVLLGVTAVAALALIQRAKRRGTAVI
jgi:hypothetical protein